MIFLISQIYHWVIPWYLSLVLISFDFSQSLTLSHVLKSSKILVLIWYTLYNIHMTCFWLISTNCKHFVFMFARLIWFTYFLGVGLELGVIVLILGINLIVLYKKNRSTKLLKMIINSPVIITGIMTMALVSSKICAYFNYIVVFFHKNLKSEIFCKMM